MGIRHSVTKASGEKGYASEWNAEHAITSDIDMHGFTLVNMPKLEVATTSGNTFSVRHVGNTAKFLEADPEASQLTIRDENGSDKFVVKATVDNPLLSIHMPVSMSGNRITNLGAPVDPNDAARKADIIQQPLAWKTVVGTTDAITGSTDPEDVPEMSITIEQDGTYLVIASMTVSLGTEVWVNEGGGIIWLVATGKTPVPTKIAFKQLNTAEEPERLTETATITRVWTLSAGNIVKLQWEVVERYRVLKCYARTDLHHRTLTVIRLA